MVDLKFALRQTKRNRTPLTHAVASGISWVGFRASSSRILKTGAESEARVATGLGL